MSSTSTAEQRTDRPSAPADAAAEANEAIAVLRGQIDSLDEAIIRLVAERTKLSARVQSTRVNAGGTRVQLGRERVIRNAYRETLGEDGPAVAEAVLQVCRGRR